MIYHMCVLFSLRDSKDIKFIYQFSFFFVFVFLFHETYFFNGSRLSNEKSSVLIDKPRLKPS